MKMMAFTDNDYLFFTNHSILLTFFFSLIRTQLSASVKNVQLEKASFLPGLAIVQVRTC